MKHFIGPLVFQVIIVTPSFTVTPAIRSSSALGSAVSEAVVGEHFIGPLIFQVITATYFTVTSAIRSSSGLGSAVSEAVVGETLYWTIDIPGNYSNIFHCDFSYKIK